MNNKKISAQDINRKGITPFFSEIRQEDNSCLFSRVNNFKMGIIEYKIQQGDNYESTK